MSSVSLTGKQRKYLRGLAHGAKVLVTVGRRGLSEGTVAEIDAALSSHELIKIRLGEGSEMTKQEKRELCAAVADQVQCGVAGLVGHVGVLYRPAQDPDERRIRLPAVAG